MALTKVTIAPNVVLDDLPLIVAIQEGFLAEEGIEAVLPHRSQQDNSTQDMFQRRKEGMFEEGKSQFGHDGRLEELRPSTKIKMRAFDRWVKESQRLHREALRVRRTLGERLGPDQMTDLSYEEFISDEGKRHTLGRLSNFLGIEPIPLADGGLKKATSNDLRSAVANYNTLKLRYSLTSMRGFFED